MRTIYLLRHAKSSWKDETLDDFDRPLAKRGKRAASTIGAYLATYRIEPAQVLCSPAKRTRETLERIQEAVGAPLPTRFERAIYMADAPVLLRRLRRLSDQLASIMVVGHNPGLERLAMILTEAGEETLRRRMAEKFPTAAIAVIAADIDHWADLQAGCGRLENFIQARELEAE